jgi:hypothetical protein
VPAQQDTTGGNETEGMENPEAGKENTSQHRRI